MNQWNDARIAVIGGGQSNERLVSLQSARTVSQVLREHHMTVIDLDPSKPEFFRESFDIAFNCLHGQWGEDGGLQGYCDMRGIPYTGSGIMASAIGFDKPMFKRFLNQLAIPTPNIWDPTMPYPCVAKPRRGGSSIGIYMIHNDDEMAYYCQQYPHISGSDYFFERRVMGTEITAGVLMLDGQLTMLPLTEIQTNRDFYDETAKYTRGHSSYITPANVPSELRANIEAISTAIYTNLYCKGCIRIDMVVDNDTPYVLEINTNPGLTPVSHIPAQAMAMGMDMIALIEPYLLSAS